MKFVCYDSWDQLPDSASELFLLAAQDNVFFSRPWFECLSSTQAENKQSLVLACVEDAGLVKAMLPVLSPGNNSWYALKHGFTPVYSLLLSDDDKEQVLSFLASALSQRQVKGLLLEPVARDDSNIDRLKHGLEQAGYSCDYLFRSYNWIYRTQGQSFADYMKSRPSKLRNTIARKSRKLQREHGYEIRLFTSADDVLANMADYYQVYHASWKQNEISNARFQDCFVDAFSQAGWSRLGILYVADQPVAAQLWFVHNNKASIFRLAYDEAWRHYSTGSILTHYLMQYAIDTDKVTEIDFLTGNDTYKQDWMSERRERFLLSCVNTDASPSLFARFIHPLKHLLRR